MNPREEFIEEATALLAAGSETKALLVLREAALATQNPDVLAEIHELASTGHESSHGFHKIEWHRLMIETESEPTTPAAA